MISGAASAVSGISDLLCLSTPLQDAAGSIGRTDKVAQQSLKLFRLLQPKNFISKIPKPFFLKTGRSSVFQLTGKQTNKFNFLVLEST